MAYEEPAFCPLANGSGRLWGLWAIGTSRSTLSALHRYQQHHGNNPKQMKIYQMAHPLIPSLYHWAGGQWSKFLLPHGTVPSGLRFVGSQFGYYWTGHHITMTNNGGKSWTRERLPFSLSITSVWFISPRIGWLTSSNGAILYHTINGGLTWTDSPRVTP